MPIIRKVLDVGNSKAITIPKTWFEFYERKTGEKIHKVTMEVNRVLKIAPLPKEKKTGDS